MRIIRYVLNHDRIIPWILGIVILAALVGLFYQMHAETQATPIGWRCPEGHVMSAASTVQGNPLCLPGSVATPVYRGDNQ